MTRTLSNNNAAATITITNNTVFNMVYSYFLSPRKYMIWIL